MSLTRLAITRPVTILMLVLALVILGLQSRSRLPVDLYPNIEFPMLFISTIYPGTGPEEMETLVTKPVEDAVSTISGLKKLTSTSSEGVSNVMMQFEIGTNLDTVSSDVRSKLDALRNSLPQDAKAPVVRKLDIGALPVVQLNISSTRYSSLEVRRLADDLLKDRFSQLPGVASVGVSGGDVREVRVEVDKARLEAYHLNIAQVVAALQAENLNLPSGTIKEARRNYAVRVMGEFTTPEQIQHVRITSALDPNLTIHDIATVHDTLAEPEALTRLNREPSVSIVIQKQSDANTVKVVDGVRKELGKLTGRDYTNSTEGVEPKVASLTAPVLSREIKAVVALDQSTFIKEALEDVSKSLLEGALLAVLIVFLFLHSLRGTFIVGLAIPISMIATFMVMRALGFSINMMSMLGLSLSVGILVDDSIVVIENIHRHLAMGEPPKEAALNGRTEIGLAAMTITLVDVVVFVPIAFMGGIVGQFFRQFGIVVASATLFSLFISFTLTPMLASRWLKSHAQEEEAEATQHEHPGLFRRFVDAWERFYGILDGAYRHVLAWALDHRPLVICLGLMTMVASLGSVAPKIPLPHTLDQGLTLLSGLSTALFALAVVYLLWAGIRLTRRGLRILLAFLGIVVSVALVVVASKVASVGTPLLLFVMLIVTFGIIGYMLSLPRGMHSFTIVPAMFRPLATWMSILLLVILFLPTKFSFEFQPKVDRRQFAIKVEQEVGTPLEVTNETAQQIEDWLLALPEMKTVTTAVGSSSGGHLSAGSSGADIAGLDVELKDIDELRQTVPPLPRQLMKLGLMKTPFRSTDDVIKLVNDTYASMPGVKITASAQAGGPGGAPVSIEVSGPSLARTRQVAREIADVLRVTEGIYSTDISYREGRPELQALIDRDRAAQYGISVAQIANALRTSLEGDTTTKYRENGKEYDIRVSLPKDQRDIINQVPMMAVGTTPGGKPVYLYEVVNLKQAGGPTKVERISRQRSVTVTAQLAKGFALGNVQRDVAPKIAQLDTSGVTVYWSGQAEMMQESGDSMFSALLLSVVLVFMLMAALFESLLAPLIIMMSVPLAMAGGIFALTITQKTLSIVSMIGFIMLVGLVTKNAILMVDYTNTLRRDEGLDRRSALLRAGPTRLRPILMTTLAMIFGMMPTAIALSKGSEMRQPMAIAVIGGLLLSLLLTLLMVPVFYEIFDELGHRVGEAKTRLLEKAKV